MRPRQLQFTATSVAAAAFPLLAPNGTAAAPSYAFAAEVGLGIYRAGAADLGIGISGGQYYSFRVGGFLLLSNAATLSFGANADVILVRTAAAVLSLQDADAAQEFRVWGATTGSKYLSMKHDGTNGLVAASSGSVYLTSGGASVSWNSAEFIPVVDSVYNLGHPSFRWGTGYFGTSVLCAPGSGATAGPVTVTELLTVAAAATTDSTLEIPAGALILSCAVRVTTVIPTAATFTVTTATGGTTLGTAAVSTAADSTDKGTAAGAFYQSAATKVRITPNAQPADNTGRIRLSVTYWVSTPATS